MEDSFAQSIAAMIAENGVPVKFEGPSAKFVTVGFYSEKITEPAAGGAGLELHTKRTLYVPANSKIPEPGDVVAFGKTRTRVLAVSELGAGGKNIVFVLRLQ